MKPLWIASHGGSRSFSLRGSCVLCVRMLALRCADAGAAESAVRCECCVVVVPAYGRRHLTEHREDCWREGGGGGRDAGGRAVCASTDARAPARYPKGKEGQNNVYLMLPYLHATVPRHAPMCSISSPPSLGFLSCVLQSEIEFSACGFRCVAVLIERGFRVGVTH